MYRGTFIDSMGRKRERMGFYGLSKPNLHRCSEVVLVEARNKVSAANKINRKYKACISPSNLREVRKGRGELMELIEEVKYM